MWLLWGWHAPTLQRNLSLLYARLWRGSQLDFAFVVTLSGRRWGSVIHIFTVSARFASLGAGGGKVRSETRCVLGQRSQVTAVTQHTAAFKQFTCRWSRHRVRQVTAVLVWNCLSDRTVQPHPFLCAAVQHPFLLSNREKTVDTFNLFSARWHLENMQMPAVAYSWSRKLIDLSCELTQHMHKHKGHGRGSETWQPLTFCYQSEQEAGRRLKATCYAHFQLRAFTVRADAWVKNNRYLTYIGYEDRCLVIGCPSQLRFELGGASNADI